MFTSADTRRNLLQQAAALPPAQFGVPPPPDNASVAQPPAAAVTSADSPSEDDSDYAPTASSGASFYIITAWGLEEVDAPPQTGVNASEILGDDIAASLESVRANFEAALTLPIPGDPLLSPLWQALLISSCALIGVFIFHVILRATAIRRKIRIPNILLWPVPELILLAALLPILVAAAAPLLVGSGIQLFVGIVFGVLIPFFYITWMVYMVAKHVSCRNPDDREAVFVIEEEKRGRDAGEGEQDEQAGTEPTDFRVVVPFDDFRAARSEEVIDSAPDQREKDAAQDAQSGSGDTSEAFVGENGTNAENQQGSGGIADQPALPVKPSPIRSILTPLWVWITFLYFKFLRYFFGYRALPEGTWMSTDHYSDSFVARYGALFSVARGPPMKLIEGTYEFDRDQGRTDRGMLVPVEVSSPEVKFLGLHASPKVEHAMHAMQAFAGVFQIVKMVLAAWIMDGMSSSDSINPILIVSLMLVITFMDWTYVRFLCPFENHAELILASFWCMCDAGTYICGMIIAFTSASEVDRL